MDMHLRRGITRGNAVRDYRVTVIAVDSAVLRAIVQFLIAGSLEMLAIPPPAPATRLAVLSVMTQFVIVGLPLEQMIPPPDAAVLFVMAQSLIVGLP